MYLLEEFATRRHTLQSIILGEAAVFSKRITDFDRVYGRLTEHEDGAVVLDGPGGAQRMGQRGAAGPGVQPRAEHLADPRTPARSLLLLPTLAQLRHAPWWTHRALQQRSPPACPLGDAELLLAPIKCGR